MIVVNLNFDEFNGRILISHIIQDKRNKTFLHGFNHREYFCRQIFNL